MPEVEVGTKTMKTASLKQHLTYRGKTINVTVDFLSETTGAKMKCHNIFQVLKKN